MVGGYTADLAYVLTAIWESFPPRWAIRWWMLLRYRGLASRYDRQVIAQDEDYGMPLQAALGQITAAPRRILDVGTGTGFAAHAVSEVFPHATVIGCDLSPEMLQQARERGGGVMFVRCDSTHLPFPASAFDLTVVSNSPPPVRELARITGPGGTIVIGFSSGARLPTWTLHRLAGKLRALGCADVAWEPAGEGLFIVARKRAETGA